MQEIVISVVLFTGIVTALAVLILLARSQLVPQWQYPDQRQRRTRFVGTGGQQAAEYAQRQRPVPAIGLWRRWHLRTMHGKSHGRRW